MLARLHGYAHIPLILIWPARKICVAYLKKHKNCTHSKSDIFFLHRHFSGFYKGYREICVNQEIYTDLKKLTQTWLAGLHVFSRYAVLLLSEWRITKGLIPAHFDTLD